MIVCVWFSGSSLVRKEENMCRGNNRGRRTTSFCSVVLESALLVHGLQSLPQKSGDIIRHGSKVSHQSQGLKSETSAKRL